MRKTIKDILEETFNNQRAWNYYSNQNFSNLPLKSIKESKKFIRDFFRSSGKDVNPLNKQIDELKDRAIHIVSAFLLGHYLYETTLLKTKIDREIARLRNSLNLETEVEFPFIWFLVCLFHDLGYNIENGGRLRYKTVKKLISVNGELNQVSGVPELYSTIYKNYFQYRMKEHCVNDHGITIAHIMYKSLCQIRERADVLPNAGQKKLCWEKDLDRIYNFCAWNVLAHNIWFGKRGNKYDEIVYTQYKIERLLLNKQEYEINLNQHPFFFLFCLVDAIEPYKKVLDFESLSQVELEILNDKIIITSNLKCNCGNAVLAQAESLNKWLTYTKKQENNVVISLTQNKI